MRRVVQIGITDAIAAETNGRLAQAALLGSMLRRASSPCRVRFGIVVRVVGDDVTPALAQERDLVRVGDNRLGHRLVVIEGRVRGVDHLVSGLARAQTEIGVVEGDGQILLVEPANGVEDARGRSRRRRRSPRCNCG